MKPEKKEEIAERIIEEMDDLKMLLEEIIEEEYSRTGDINEINSLVKAFKSIVAEQIEFCADDCLDEVQKPPHPIFDTPIHKC